MPNKKIEFAQRYMTAPQVRDILKLSRPQLDLRLARGILPKPTMVDENGVRYFDQNWVEAAKVILRNNYAVKQTA